MLTTLDLLESMKTELEKVFGDMLFRKENGEMTRINIFKQRFPLRELELGEVSEEEIFPYCVIRAVSGEVQEQNPQRVDITITFGVYDNDKADGGEIRILNLIERVAQRFESDRILNGRYWLDGGDPIRWAIAEEEETYPYHFGLMEMTWGRPSRVQKEDRYA